MHPICKYENAHLFTIVSYEYDAVCCALCNVWLDTSCQDPDCEFCSIRPSTPLDTQAHLQALSLIQEYAKNRMIPPESEDEEAWDDLSDKIMDMIAANLNS